MLLRLLGEIFLFVHTAPGVQLWIGPVSACRSPEGVCSSLRQDRGKGTADSGALAHSGRGKGGVRSAGRACGGRGPLMLQQPEAHRAFSRGSCPWITGPWQSWAAQAPRRGGVDSDLCLYTGFLVAATAALMSHARLWVPR